MLDERADLLKRAFCRVVGRPVDVWRATDEHAFARWTRDEIALYHIEGALEVLAGHGDASAAEESLALVDDLEAGAFRGVLSQLDWPSLLRAGRPMSIAEALALEHRLRATLDPASVVLVANVQHGLVWLLASDGALAAHDVDRVLALGARTAQQLSPARLARIEELSWASLL